MKRGHHRDIDEQRFPIKIEFDHPVMRAARSLIAPGQAWAKNAGTQCSRARQIEGPDRRATKEIDAVLVSHYYASGLAGSGGRNRRVCPIHWKWRVSAVITQPRPSWCAACASWAKRPRSWNPEKRVLMPELEAECSLDLGCPPDEFTAFAMPILTAPSWCTRTPVPRSKRAPIGW